MSVKVTQADREAAMAYWAGWSNNVPEHDGVIHPLVQAFAAHREAAIVTLSAQHDKRVSELLAANNREVERRRAIVEECAKVAEDRHEHWCEPGDHAVECDVSACRDIAAAIRSLGA